MSIWTIWLLAIAGSFVALEAHAIMTSRTTLSRYVWHASKTFPPLPLIVGLIGGFLACHFWWGGVVCFAPV